MFTFVIHTYVTSQVQAQICSPARPPPNKVGGGAPPLNLLFVFQRGRDQAKSMDSCQRSPLRGQILSIGVWPRGGRTNCVETKYQPFRKEEPHMCVIERTCTWHACAPAIYIYIYIYIYVRMSIRILISSISHLAY